MQLQNHQPSASASPSEHMVLTAPTGDADIWASEHLEDFAGQMASNGLAVSCVRLRNDAAYTLRQLAAAHSSSDETLRQMAMTLFRQFERNRSGIPS